MEDKNQMVNEEQNTLPNLDERSAPEAGDAVACASHTPGPWTASEGDRLYDGSDCWVIDSETESIAEMMCAAEVEEANARLIAAAPDLLKAATAASHALKGYAFGNAAPDLAEEVAAFCDAAISKATSSHPSV